MTLDIHEAFFQVSPFSKTSNSVCVSLVLHFPTPESRSEGSVMCVCERGGLMKVLPHFAPYSCRGGWTGRGCPPMEGGATKNGPSASGNPEEGAVGSEVVGRG